MAIKRNVKIKLMIAPGRIIAPEDKRRFQLWAKKCGVYKSAITFLNTPREYILKIPKAEITKCDLTNHRDGKPLIWKMNIKGMPEA